MITTRRSTNESNTMFYGNEGGNVAVLEKENTSNYAEYSGEKVIEEEDYQKAKQRMHENLERILNQGKFAEEVKDVEQEYKEIDEVKANQDEDIRPTSTTMQFGDGDVNTLMNEMQNEGKEDVQYKINKKGKIVVALYTACVAVVLALIVINTGLIALLTSKQEASANELANAVSAYNQSVAELNEATSEEHIVDLAENVYKMVK